MQRNLIFEYCKEPENEGLSIWHFPKGKKRPLYLASNLETIPNFDANCSYIVIQQRNNYSVLNN